MSLVHEKLYQSEHLAKINFQLYINDLISYLFRSYKADPGQIKLNLNIEDIFLDVESAIPCGLIINELVSNSLKYAFPRGRAGEIYIGLHLAEGDKFTLTVKDNGIGLPKGMDFRKTESLGMQLVSMLTEQ